MLLSVTNLKTCFRLEDGRIATAADGVSFTVDEGETVALVGESGCGKSVTALSILRLLPDHAFHPAGGITFDGRELLGLSEPDMARIRGDRIAMIFQEPMTSLNPVMRIGRQVMEPLRIHRGMDERAALAEALALLKRVGIPAPEQRLHEYPHQLSGGMRQRVMIAMALACRPRLLIADEPTTALDVTIQAQILRLIQDLQVETGMAVLFITHDLGIVNQVADRVCVMYAGQVVEAAPREELFRNMAYPYTRGLFRSLPRGSAREAPLLPIPGAVPAALADLPPGCRFQARCHAAFSRCAQEESAFHAVSGSAVHAGRCHWLENAAAPPAPAAVVLVAAPGPIELPSQGGPILTLEDLRAWFPVRQGFFGRVAAHVKAVDGVSLTVARGETIALVGESGCGKTTVGLSLLRLLREAEGRVVFQGIDVMGLGRRELRALRRRMQVVFQDPFASLSPRLTVGEIVGEGLRIHEPGLDEAERQRRIGAALAEVGLDDAVLSRYPHEFSGGQRQRISLARALVLNPEFLVLDEPTSALDVSVQAQILNLLAHLRDSRRMTCLLITHNLAVVGYLADSVAVMYLGRIVEQGPARELLRDPRHPYTRTLLAAVPDTAERRPLPRFEGEVPSPLHPPDGCHFHPRCPLLAAAPEGSLLRQTCPVRYPGLDPAGPHRTVACHAVTHLPADGKMT